MALRRVCAVFPALRWASAAVRAGPLASHCTSEEQRLTAAGGQVRLPNIVRPPTADGRLRFKADFAFNTPLTAAAALEQMGIKKQPDRNPLLRRASKSEGSLVQPKDLYTGSVRSRFVPEAAEEAMEVTDPAPARAGPESSTVLGALNLRKACATWPPPGMTGSRRTKHALRAMACRRGWRQRRRAGGRGTCRP